MRKHYFSCIIIGLAFMIIILSGCANNSANRKNLEQSNGKHVNQSAEKNSKTKNNPPTTSGPVDNVPWKTNPNFKAAQQQSGASIQMAAYCTALRDPLPGEENNVHLAARYLAGKIVQPGEVFSQNLSIGPYSQSRGFQKGPVYIGSQLQTTIGGGVCKMASTLYNVAILCDLPIVERHAHGMPVPYVPYGQDATVSYGFKDFKFKNTNSYPILIWAEGVENILYVGFYGQGNPPQVEWHHEVLQSHKSYRLYKYNPALPKGTEKVIIPGMDGAVIKSWVKIINPDGSSSIKALGKSYYSPMPSIIEKNTSGA